LKNVYVSWGKCPEEVSEENTKNDHKKYIV